MKFTIGKQALLSELNLLQGVVERKNTIPILTNLLVEATGASNISLLATDLDVTMRTGCAADVPVPGNAVIQAKKLFDIVRSLPDGDITFEKEADQRVKVTSGYSRFRIVGQAREHFPSTPEPKPGVVEIRSEVLQGMIIRTMFGITQEESRYSLSGALMLLNKQGVTFVTTDGHRLAWANSGLEGPEEEIRTIVPKKTVAEMLKLAAASDKPVSFSRDENHIFFAFGHRHLISRVLSGQFPNYEMVMPKGNDKQVVLNLERLSASVKRAALMADERSHGVKFAIGGSAPVPKPAAPMPAGSDSGVEDSAGTEAVEPHTLCITSQAADVGESREVLDVDYDGPAVTLKFNAQYVLDFLNVVDTEKIIIELKDDETPALFRPGEASAMSYKYVVMPMRLS